MINPDVVYFPRQDILRAADKFPTPFFLYKENRIRENCTRINNAFGKYFKKFWPLYAVKANPNPHILKIILDKGFELDCSSGSEVWIANKLGAKGMFTGNYNPKEELQQAKDSGFILNLDDISMIPFLQDIGVPKILSFRINPGIGGAELDTNVLAGPDAKFGIPFEQAYKAYKGARKLGVKKFGIHMMTGSNVLDVSYFIAVVEKLFEIIADIKEKSKVQIDFMNIGGGFGVPYNANEKNIDIEEVAKVVRRTFDIQCKKYDLQEPMLMIEPGRFITADAGWLIGKVLVIKQGYKKFVGIDAASNDMPRPWIYGAYHHISVINNASEQEKVSVVGRLCENNDQFAKDRILPKCNIGDIVVVHNSGGHAYSMGGNYNGRVRHAEYLLTLNGSIKKIRRAETYQDLFDTIQ